MAVICGGTLMGSGDCRVVDGVTVVVLGGLCWCEGVVVTGAVLG